MKTFNYQRRAYRETAGVPGKYREQIVECETDIYIAADRPVDVEFCRERIRHYRRQIQRYIERDERFLTALGPIPVERTAAPIVKTMAAAARAADVGPMAAVAGAIAQRLGNDLARRGHREIFIENGGDIYVRSGKNARIGVYAGDSPFTGRLSIIIPAVRLPAGVCTSSGTVGHSLSFGSADAVVIAARNAALADSAATAVANMVNGPDDFRLALRRAAGINGVFGCVAIVKDRIAGWGDVRLAKNP
jgi:hypothetical protein